MHSVVNVCVLLTVTGSAVRCTCCCHNSPTMLLRKVRILQLILLPSTFVIFAPSCHCFLLPRQSSIIMADEFGDDNFLDDFDVDTAVLRKRESLSPSARHDQNPYKKPKRSPLRALPFNKRITVGTKVDYPQEIVASEAPDLSVDEYRQEPMLPQTAAKPLLTKALTQTLQKYFGYSNFRSGQLEVIQASLEQRDVGVFWATGSGKSLCYQIPALHTGHIAVVVSPLISLMEDQVHKLNGLREQPLATFFGFGASRCVHGGPCVGRPISPCIRHAREVAIDKLPRPTCAPSQEQKSSLGHCN